MWRRFCGWEQSPGYRGINRHIVFIKSAKMGCTLVYLCVAHHDPLAACDVPSPTGRHGVAVHSGNMGTSSFVSPGAGQFRSPIRSDSSIGQNIGRGAVSLPLSTSSQQKTAEIRPRLCFRFLLSVMYVDMDDPFRVAKSHSRSLFLPTFV